MSLENNTPIGTVVVYYDRDGKPTEAFVEPAKFKLDCTIPETELLSEHKAETPDDAKTHAQAVLSRWFLHVEAFELTDREEGYIDTEVVKCEKWGGTDKPRACTFNFVFKRRA